MDIHAAIAFLQAPEFWLGAVLFLLLGILLGGFTIGAIAGREHRRLLEQITRLQRQAWAKAVEGWPSAAADPTRARSARSAPR